MRNAIPLRAVERTENSEAIDEFVRDLVHLPRYHDGDSVERIRAVPTRHLGAFGPPVDVGVRAEDLDALFARELRHIDTWARADIMKFVIIGLVK